MLNGLDIMEPGDFIRHQLMNELIRRALAGSAGPNLYYAPQTGLALRRQLGGGGLDAVCVEIVRYGTGKFGTPNSSLIVQPVPDNGETPTDPATEFEVFVRSYPNLCREDVSVCLPCFVPGDRVMAAPMRFVAGNTLIDGPFLWDSVVRLCP